MNPNYNGLFFGAANASYGAPAMPPTPQCYLVHEWKRHGRDEVCAFCGLHRSRGVDVSRRNHR